MEFTNRVGEIVEEDHYSVIFTEYECVTVDWRTHKIGGLHKNDFIMSAKTDELRESV